MGMYTFTVVLADDNNGTVLVTCPDLPEVVTFGEDEAGALDRAVDAIETAIIGRMSDREDVPTPARAARGAKTVTLPPLSAAKVALYQAMRAQGVRKAELGRRLGLHMPQVDRLLDLRHASRLDQLVAGLRAVGKQLTVGIQDAA
jgi:antitoxin HicB